MTPAQSFCPEELSELAKLVNEKTKCGRVNFFATQEEGAETVSYFAIFQSRPKRETKALKECPAIADVDHIVEGLEAWAGYSSNDLASLYSPEPPPSPANEWD